MHDQILQAYYANDARKHPVLLWVTCLQKSNCSMELIEAENRLSLIAIVGYSFENDIDLDNWICRSYRKNKHFLNGTIFFKT